jgi:hypothetical protein
MNFNGTVAQLSADATILQHNSKLARHTFLQFLVRVLAKKTALPDFSGCAISGLAFYFNIFLKQIYHFSIRLFALPTMFYYTQY